MEVRGHHDQLHSIGGERRFQSFQVSPSVAPGSACVVTGTLKQRARAPWKMATAPGYVGFSMITESPGRTNALLIRSKDFATFKRSLAAARRASRAPNSLRAAGTLIWYLVQPGEWWWSPGRGPRPYRDSGSATGLTSRPAEMRPQSQVVSAAVSRTPRTSDFAESSAYPWRMGMRSWTYSCTTS